MLECPVDTFLIDYAPFLPNDALVDAAIQTLASEQLLVLDEQGKPQCWKDFDEERCGSAQEPTVLTRLEAIASYFDNTLGELDGRQQHFFYDMVKVGIVGSNLEVDACFTGRRQADCVTCAEAAVVVAFEKSDSEDVST
jgi:hypothetical protein